MKRLATRASTKPLYAALGLPETATSEEIHATFLCICRTHHPDVPGADAGLFSRAKYAHDILMDTEKRRIYDETGLDPEDTNVAPQVKAIALIRQITAELLADGTIDIDVIAHIRRAIREDIKAVKARVTEVNRRIRTAEKFRDKLAKHLKAPRHIEGSLNGMVAEALAAAETEKTTHLADIAEFESALALLAGCRYDGEDIVTYESPIARHYSGPAPMPQSEQPAQTESASSGQSKIP